MASVTITGGGSIPSRSKTFTSDGTSDGHSKLFTEIHEFVNEWLTETIDADAAARTASEATIPPPPSDTPPSD